MKSTNQYELDAFDAELATELRRSLPDRIFDAHAHPFLLHELDTDSTPILKELPENGGMELWKHSTAAIVGEGRVRGGLFFGLPVLPAEGMDERIKRVNEFVISELKRSRLPDRRGLLLAANGSDPALLERQARLPLVAGFKPYASLNPECGAVPDICEYLPEWLCDIAHTHELAVTLHILKPKALDDEDNIDMINSLLRRFTGMKLILAHAGSGFNMYNTIKGCEKLVMADNLWFDLSAVCEPSAITALMRRFGHKRLMWGSDYPISLRKGRIVTLGNMMLSLQSNTVPMDRLHPLCRPYLLGLENIRAVLQAISEHGGGADMAEDVFYRNAAALFEVG